MTSSDLSSYISTNNTYTAVNIVNNEVKTISVSVKNSDENTPTLELTGVEFDENANNHILITKISSN